MKLLFMGDFHERERRPLSRIDSWQDTVDAKAKEIQEIAQKNGAQAILQTGDFLDTPKISESYLQEIIRRWNFTKMSDLQIDMLNKKRFNKSNINQVPMIGVIGNHEIFGNSLKNFEKTHLSVLEEMGFLRLVDREPVIIKNDNTTIAITGCSYKPGMDNDIENTYAVKEKLADVHIHIVHGFGVTENFPDFIPHTNIEEIAKITKADLTILGHDHFGFDPVQIDGKWFVNPGAVTRLTADEKEFDRTVKVGLIDILENGEISIDMIPLKSAKAADDCLSREHIERRNNKKIFIKNINDEADRANVASRTTIKDIVEEISINSNIDTESKDDLLNRFNEKMQNVPSQIKAVEDYTIDELHLINFQSHADSKFTFGKLNVFTGESGAGKTSILRAFSWIMEDKFKNSRRFIYKDSAYASATIKLSNGIEITRMIERKKSGFNGYIIKYEDGTEEKLNTQGVSVVQNLLGFHYLQISEDNSKQPLNLNFSKQGEGWFFIGPEVSGPDRAKIIGSIYKTHIADSIQKELDLSVKRNTTLLKDKQKESEDLGNKIATMSHIEPMEECIKKCEELLIKYDTLQERLKKVRSLEADMNLLESKIKLLTSKSEELNGLLESKKIINKAKEDINTLKEIKNFNELDLKLKGLSKNIEGLSNIDKYKEVLSSYTQKINLVNSIELRRNELNELSMKVKRIEKAKDELLNLEDAKKKIIEITLKIKRLNDISVLSKSLDSITKKGKMISNLALDLENSIEGYRNKLNLIKSKTEMYNKIKDTKFELIDKSINDLDIEINKNTCILSKLKHEYWDELKALDACPTCKQPLSIEAKKNMARQRTSY